MTTITVTTQDDIVAVDGKVSLREAILAANTGAAVGDAPAGTGADTIVFDPSVSLITLSLGQLDITGTLTIDGDRNNDGTPDVAISGNSAQNIFKVQASADVVLDGLTLQDGRGFLNGTAVSSVAGSTLTISNSVLNQNDSFHGGAVEIGGTATILNSSFSANTSQGDGGAIIAQASSSLTVLNSTFDGNQAGNNAGAIMSWGTTTVVNSTFAGNGAFVSGGAISSSSGIVTILNSTISHNIAATGSGLFANGGMALQNTVVAGNVGSPDVVAFGGATLVSLGGNFVGDGNGQLVDGVNGDQVGTTASPLDPMLGGLVYNGGLVRTMAPLSGSPLIDAGHGSLPADTLDLDNDGDTTEALPIDADGNVRIRGAAVDIGAVETGLVVTSDLDSGDDAAIAGTLAADIADGGGLSLREAANWVTSGGTIGFARDMTISLSNQILLNNKSVTIDGGGQDIVLSGGNAHRIFDFGLYADIVVDGLVLTNGASGGQDGGAIRSYGSLAIRNSTFSNNRSLSDGGAVYAFGRTTVTNTTFYNNYAGDDGGALFFKDTTYDALTIANSTFSGNESYNRAGGLFFDGEAVGSRLINVTFYGNSTKYGGAIYNADSDLTIVNSTIAGNHGTNGGGGIATSGSSGHPSTVLKNTVVAANTGQGDLAIAFGATNNFSSQGHNFIGDGRSLLPDGINGDRVGSQAAPLDAKLGLLQNNGGPVQTMQPDADSPLINRGSKTPDTLDLDNDGDTTETLPLDARGQARTQNGVIDIGAFEVTLNQAPTIDVDGFPDAVNAGIAGFRVLIGFGPGNFVPMGGPNVGTPTAVELADIDGDGDLDALVADAAADVVRLLTGDGAGGFLDGTTIAVGVMPTDIAMADMNGDGHIDAVVANRASNSIQVLLGDGAGNFIAQVPEFTAGTPQMLALGDMNDDGKLDALVTLSNVNTAVVLLGDGAGGFGAVPAWSFPTGIQPWSVALGDLDGDGLLDAVITNANTNSLTVALATGGGSFPLPTTVAAGAMPYAVALGDVNGDGNLDALVTNVGSVTVSVLLGDGVGGFGPRTDIPVAGTPLELALRDLDEDGDLDAVFSTQSGFVQALIGHGDGTFVVAPPVFTGVSGPLAVGDVNNARPLDEDDTRVFTTVNGTAIILADADSGGADETLTLNVSHGILTLGTTAGLTSVNGNATGSVTLSGSIGELNAAIDGLLYTPALDYNGRDLLTLTLNDNDNTGAGGAKTATALVPLVIAPLADPTASVPVGLTTSEDTPLAVTGFSVSDTDSTTLKVTLTAVSTLTLSQLTGLSFTAGDGTADTTMTFTGTVADINAALNGMTYTPSADFSGAGGFTYSIDDSSDTSPTTGSVAIAVTAVNDGPAITAPASVAGVEDQPLTLTGISVSDVDAGGAAIAVTFSVSAGQGTLAAVSGGGVTVNGSGSNAVSLIGSMASINAFIAASLLSYAPAANANGNVALGISVSDQGNTGSGGAKLASGQTTLAIAAVDDAPTLTLTATLPSLSETADTSSAHKVADIAINDVDGGSNLLSLTGADKDMFVITGTELFLKAGAHLDFETDSRLDVTVNVDNGIGAGPDASASLAVNIIDVAETITGNKKDNVLTGTSVSELINGKGGDDTIKGGGGADTIIGGPGADVLKGGGGPDVFVFRPGDLPKISDFSRLFSPLNTAHDTITDFRPGTDTIDLSAIDANTHRNGNQKFHFEGRGDLSGSRGELVYEFYGNKAAARHTIVKGDTNGDGAYDLVIVLKGHHHLDAGDFIL